jgi:hypothetical protein
MQSPTTRKIAVLKEIRVGFSRYRRGNQGCRGSGYPTALKELAVSALHQGCTSSEVSEAAEVTGESLRNWRGSVKGVSVAREIRPVELKLVESRDPSLAPTPSSLEKGLSSEAIARIELRSGVRMTLPVSALSERLLSLLMGGAS